jgi:class 3 adenylate cyclase
MEPRIQYAKTKDGANIGFYTLGDGPPLVVTPGGIVGHLHLEWQVLDVRSWLRTLAQHRMVIHYDVRNSGLSKGGEGGHSLESWMLDLEAVVDRLGLESFSLFAYGFLGPASIAYAAQNPGKVSALILWNTARGPGFFGTSRDRALAALMEGDWALYTEVLAHLSYGWSAGEGARNFAARMRQFLSPQEMRQNFRDVMAMDASDHVSNIRCPTLVVERRDSQWRTESRELAASIPDARLVIVEGGSFAPFTEDAERGLSAVEEFLSAVGETPAPITVGDATSVRTVLFTDIEASTALTERAGDAKARQILRGYEQLVRDALQTHSGAEVKTMGDGFMASFPSPARALDCAIAIQRAVAERNESASDPLLIRIGLNAGEPIAEEQDLFGTAVILAARIAGQADGGEILASNVVRELAAGKGFLFADRGEVALRGFEDPARLYEVRWRE